MTKMMQRTSWKFNFDGWELQADCRLTEEPPPTPHKQYQLQLHILPFVHVTGSRKNGEQNRLQTKLKTVLSVISMLHGETVVRFSSRKV